MELINNAPLASTVWGGLLIQGAKAMEMGLTLYPCQLVTRGGPLSTTLGWDKIDLKSKYWLHCYIGHIGYRSNIGSIANAANIGK